MKIYSMTATFGKLEHQTLELEPGLNIIHAPNEWGKSTWCAFLVTMLYGLNTRERTTVTALADKERYAPWSGSPMSGRIDLCWQGRDITIERRTKGRTPLGEFRAYETASGLAIPELTGANCGQTLLGVERSVFARAGFLRFSDLPVTNDDDLRHRLNALVTTGDDSGEAEALEQKLRDLKNRCRYNKSGLLPPAEARARELEKKLAELDELNAQAQYLRQRRSQLETDTAELEDHKQALAYAAAKADAARVQAAAQDRDLALERCKKAEAACEGLPTRAQALAAKKELEELRRQWDALQLEALPPVPAAPGPSPAQAQADAQRMKTAKSPVFFWTPVVGGGLLVAAVILAALRSWGSAAIFALLGLVLLNVGLICRNVLKKTKKELISLYGTDDDLQWVAQAEARERQVEQAQQARQESDRRREALRQKLAAAGPARWDRILASWAELDQARVALEQAAQYLATVQSMAKTAPAPQRPDRRTEDAAQTDRLMAADAHELRQIQLKLGQCQGQMEALGSRDATQRELDALRRRIDELELIYGALDRALKALATAKSELQRRFAPRICQQAQELFGQLTGGRYDRMTLSEDLSIQAGAAGEDTLRSPLYRSDGTVDQLYLALRLAVAKELTPEAPLILDDALIRFDGDRLATALQILRREAEEKQVILFTCQGRELGV